MSDGKVPALLWGAAAGIAMGAALIGLLLIGIATAIDLQADANAVLTRHPLFVAGYELIGTSCLAAVPLVVSWFAWQRR